MIIYLTFFIKFQLNLNLFKTQLLNTISLIYYAKRFLLILIYINIKLIYYFVLAFFYDFLICLLAYYIITILINI